MFTKSAQQVFCVDFPQDGLTALMLSVKEKNDAVTALLLENGADLDCTSVRK